METKIQKGDFIEIEFTAKLKEGGIFDSNIKEDLEKLHAGHSHPINTKPLIFSIGNHMFVEGIDEYLIGKEVNKTYNIELSPEKAFGKRNPKLIKIIPLSAFKTQKYQPQPGMTFNFDGQMAKILSVSGGRIITDFNNPLAGKDLEYKFKVIGKVDDENRKARTLFGAIFRFVPEFEVRDKVIVKGPKELEGVVKIFSDRFKNLMGKGLGFEEKKVDLGKMKNKSDKGIQ